MPNTNESNHERTMVRKPSFKDMVPGLRVKMKGKAPTRSVMIKLIRRGVKPESIPYINETIRDRNMNKALTSSAMPTLCDMALIFILLLLSQRLDSALELLVLLCKVGHTCIDVGKLIISVIRISVDSSSRLVRVYAV